jgi:hypothetical protein
MFTPKEEHQLEPWDIYGSWTVDQIVVVSGSLIGIDKDSQFKIVSGSGGPRLITKHGVQWNSEIQLVEVEEGFQRNAKFVLKGSVLLDGATHELLLGSDDGGNRLKILVRDESMAQAENGGSGGAGRP